MPNAQTHMASVCDLLAEPSLLADFPWLEDDAAQSALFLGAIGPDVRAISRQPREATHFFEIPFRRATPAQVNLVTDWPALADASTLPRTQATFVAGYMTHLIMDQTWVEQIVMPGLFIDGHQWGTRHPNWMLYSILMTYLEYRAAARLPGWAVERLAHSHPDHYLPFVKDRFLGLWRNHVVEQITGGGARQISAMFARSNRITPEELEAIVLSEDRMAEAAYPTVSLDQLDAFEAEATRRSRVAITCYLRGESPFCEEPS